MILNEVSANQTTIFLNLQGS